MPKDELLRMLDKSEQVKETKAIRDIRKENFNRDKILIDIRTLYKSEASNETGTMNTTSDNIEIMIGNETDEIIKNVFESLLQKYQEELEKSMKESEFVFDNVDFLYYIF